MILTIVSYVISMIAAIVFFHVFVHIFDMIWMFLFCFVARACKTDDQPLSQTWLMFQSTAKGLCTNILASLIGIGIINLFGKNYFAFPFVYFIFIFLSEVNLIKYCPPLRIKVELYILLGNIIAVIGVYFAIWYF